MGNEPGSWFYTYNGLLTAKTVKGVWDAYSEKEMNKELLISYGYGDEAAVSTVIFWREDAASTRFRDCRHWRLPQQENTLKI